MTGVRERETLVPCPACNPDDGVQHRSQPPPAMDGSHVRARCKACLDTRLVRPEVAAAWRDMHPLAGRPR